MNTIQLDHEDTHTVIDALIEYGHDIEDEDLKDIGRAIAAQVGIELN